MEHTQSRTHLFYLFTSELLVTYQSAEYEERAQRRSANFLADHGAVAPRSANFSCFTKQTELSVGEKNSKRNAVKPVWYLHNAFMNQFNIISPEENV